MDTLKSGQNLWSKNCRFYCTKGMCCSIKFKKYYLLYSCSASRLFFSDLKLLAAFTIATVWFGWRRIACRYCCIASSIRPEMESFIHYYDVFIGRTVKKQQYSGHIFRKLIMLRNRHFLLIYLIADNLCSKGPGHTSGP